MGHFRRSSWTIVYIERGKEQRLVLEDNAAAPRTDDTLSVVHHKLQKLTKQDIYWWTERPGRDSRWPDGKKHICPYVFGAYSYKEPFSRGAMDGDNASDILWPYIKGTTVWVCGLTELLDKNPSADSIVPRSISESVSERCVSVSEDIMERATDYEARQTVVSALTIETLHDGWQPGVDTTLLEKLDMNEDLLMMGLQASSGMIGVRVPVAGVESKRLPRAVAATEANELAKASPKASASATFVTQIEDVTCSTRTYENVHVTRCLDSFDNLDEATQAVDRATGIVAKLRKVKPHKDTLPTVRWVRINCSFDSSAPSKKALLDALDKFSSVLYWEAIDNGNVILHYKRVPNFKAANGRVRFIEHRAHRLTDGSQAALVQELMTQFEIDEIEAAKEIELYKLSTGVDSDVNNKYMKMMTEVGAMATLSVGARSLKVSLRCVGSLIYAKRMLSIIALVARAPRSVEAEVVETEAASGPDGVDEVQKALAMARDIDVQASVGPSEPLTAQRYILERLYDHDSKIFKYEKTRHKTYAKQCGAVNMRQPIVVSAQRMQELRSTNVDGTLPDTIRAGEGGNFYMCPEFWCTASETPMTREQVEANGGVCASGDVPLDLTSAKFWNNASKRSPGLLAAEKHPLGLFAPCCFKNMKAMMMSRIARCQQAGQCPRDDVHGSLTALESAERYVMASTAYPLPINRQGHLPKRLADALQGVFDGVFRIGVSQEGDPVVNCVGAVTGLTTTEVVDMVEKNLSVIKVCALAKGNLIRHFIDQTVQLHDPQHRQAFQKFMRSAPGVEFKKANASRGRDVDDARDFALWNGYVSVLRYIREGRAASHTFIVPLLMTALEINIHVLEMNDTTGISLHCPYGYSSPHKSSVVLLKQGRVYEPLAGDTDGLRFHLDGQHQQMCGSVVGPNTSDRVAHHLESVESLDVSSQVIDMSFQTIGVVAAGLYVPFDIPAPLDLSLPILYVDQLASGAGKRWTAAKAVSLFSKLAKATGSKWYADVEAVSKDGSTYLVIGGSTFVPISNAARVLELARRDLAVFTHTESAKGDQQSASLAYDAMMEYLVKAHSKELYVLTHPLCPFTKDQIVAKLLDMTSALSDLGENMRERSVRKLVSRQHREAGIVHRSDELFATDQDIVDGTFLYMFSQLENGVENVDTARSLFTLAARGPSAMVDVPRPGQWKPVLRPLGLHAMPTASYHLLRAVTQEMGGEKLTKKRYLAIVSKELLRDLASKGEGRILRPEVMESLRVSSARADSPKVEVLKYADVAPNAHVATCVLALYDVNFIVVGATGAVVGSGRSKRGQHVVVFELADKRLAVAHLEGKHVLQTADLPRLLAKRFADTHTADKELEEE